MRKTERFAFKLTPEDKQALTKLAAIEGEQVAVVLRRLIRKAIEERNIASSITTHTYDLASAKQP